MAIPHEPIINLLVEKNNKWMKIPQIKSLAGKVYFDDLIKNLRSKGIRIDLPKITPIAFLPCFTSTTYRKFKETRIEAIAGGTTKKPKYATDEYYRLRVEARMGDREAHAVNYELANIISEKNIKALGEMVDMNFDDAVKGALENYFELLGALCSKIDPYLMKKISNEKKIIDLNPSKEIFLKEKDTKRLSEILKTASAKLDAEKCIHDSGITAHIMNETRWFANSEGTRIKTRSFRAYISFIVDVRYSDDKVSDISRGLHSLSLRELVNKSRIENFLNETIAIANSVSPAPAQESGLYAAIFSPSTLGAAYHEIKAHNLSLKEILQKGSSVFGPEKIGKLDFPDFITIIDDPTKKGTYGYYKYDEEGVLGQRIVLVENGKLVNFLTDRTTAAYINQKSNGHSRASYSEYSDEDDEEEEEGEGEDIPEPRVGNIEILTSQKNSKRAVRNAMLNHLRKNKLEYGLIFYGGSGEVDTEDGAFKIYPDRVLRIYRNGKTEPVSRAYITGEPYNILSNIKMLGGTSEVSRGLCGSSSGWVCTEEKAPWAFIEKVAVRTYKPKESPTRRLDKSK